MIRKDMRNIRSHIHITHILAELLFISLTNLEMQIRAYNEKLLDDSQDVSRDVVVGGSSHRASLIS